MDGQQTNPLPQPDVQIMQKRSFIQTRKGKSILVTAIAIIIFLLLAVGLNYFDIISIANLPLLPKRPITSLTGNPVQLTLIKENYGFKAGNLVLPCPVEGTFCTSRKLVNFNNISAVAYKAASRSSVLNVSKLDSFDNIAVSTNKKAGKKYFYESVVKDQNSCYTIAYTLPSDATFGNIISLPILNSASKIATLGSGTFTVEGEDVNILIQVRNTPMDPGIPCSLLKKSPDFFKAFD